MAIKDPRMRWIPSRRPPYNPAFAIAETLWILFGRNDARLPVFFNPAFPRFSGAATVYEGAYGDRLRKFFGFDQLERAADVLSANEPSRQVVLQIWDAHSDLPLTDGQPRREDIPCNLLSMLKLRGRRLDWTQVLRSNDLVLGVPYNIVQFTTLQEVVAGWLGAEPGTYTHFSDSLHVYERDMPKLESTLLTVAARNSDSLALNRRDSAAVLGAMEERVERVVSSETLKAFCVAYEHLDLPTGYANLLYVMAADAARRRGWTDQMKEAASRCTNPALQQMWSLWSQSRSAKS